MEAEEGRGNNLSLTIIWSSKQHSEAQTNERNYTSQQ
jgi:hypothetical protein